MSIDRQRRDGVIFANCDVCHKGTSVLDKGLGRANLAAWETRHQHRTPTTTADPERAALAEGSDA